MDGSRGTESVLEEFRNIHNAPEEFVSAQTQHTQGIKSILKYLYDSCKYSEETTETKIKSALSRLITKNFDAEQIWQEIELQNKPSVLVLTKVISSATKIVPEEIKHKKTVSSPLERHKKDIPRKSELVGTEVPKRNNAKPQFGSSIVDDKFFKLRELEEFLNNEDRKEEKGDELSDSDEDSIDYFEDLPDDDEEGKLGCEARYEDFFDMPNEAMDVTNDNIEDESNKEAVESDEEMFSNLNDESDEAEEEEEEEEKEEEEQLDDDEEYDTRDVDDDKLQVDKGKNVNVVASDSESEPEVIKDTSKMSNSEENAIKSTFQKKQEKLQEKIRELEEQQLSGKPWQLRGEIAAAFRPENCLLEEHLKFDHINRPTPVITEETTEKLEDIVKQRIKDKAWDDVERKIKPPDHPFEYRRHIVLDQEKSKMSLAEVYEQEYLKHQKAEKEVEEESELPEHKEIKKLMSNLFTKLDALSNFRFKPRPPQPDVKIVSNLPALTVEEVAPVNVSDATLLAPEEVKAKVKGTLKSKTERDATDRKRERRKKKLAQKLKQKKKEKVMAVHPKLGINEKRKKKETLKKLKKKGNVTVVKESGKLDSALKSSKAFFSKLQEQSEISVPLKKKKLKR